MEKAYKGKVGGYIAIKDGDDKHDATHIVLTDTEYRQMLADKARLERELYDAQEAKEHTLTVTAQNAREYRRQADEAARKVQAEAEAEVRQAREDLDKQKKLNASLIDMMKARSNARRGLQPKKKHPGYRFVGKIMQTKTVAGHDKKTGTIYADVWTATLETPYNARLPLEQIEDYVCEELGQKRWGGGLLRYLLIKSWTFKDSPRLWKGSYADAVKKCPDDCCLFDYKFAANPKTRLWEIQIWTTKGIRAADDMMNPIKIKQSKSQKDEEQEQKSADPVADREADFVSDLDYLFEEEDPPKKRKIMVTWSDENDDDGFIDDGPEPDAKQKSLDEWIRERKRLNGYDF